MVLSSSSLLQLALFLMLHTTLARLDAAIPAHLASIVASRAPRRRIIFFSLRGFSRNISIPLIGDDATNNGWLLMSRAMYWQLSERHGDEFVALGATRGDCDTLALEHCVVNTYLPADWPWFMDTEAHWGGRYSFMSRLLGSGVDAMMLDGDFVIHDSIWTFLYNNSCALKASVAFFFGGWRTQWWGPRLLGPITRRQHGSSLSLRGFTVSLWRRAALSTSRPPPWIRTA